MRAPLAQQSPVAPSPREGSQTARQIRVCSLLVTGRARELLPPPRAPSFPRRVRANSPSTPRDVAPSLVGLAKQFGLVQSLQARQALTFPRHLHPLVQRVSL